MSYNNDIMTTSKYGQQADLSHRNQHSTQSAQTIPHSINGGGVARVARVARVEAWPGWRRDWLGRGQGGGVTVWGMVRVEAWWVGVARVEAWHPQQ